MIFPAFKSDSQESRFSFPRLNWMLLLCAAALIFRPDIILLILRYGCAVVNILLAVWLIISLIRSKI